MKATDTEDGGFACSGLLYGAAAEQAREAFRAFRRPDARDELRTPAQRAADAFEQLCAAALRSGEASRQHGVRPQVTVVFTADQYAALTDTPEQAYGLLAGSGQVASGQQLRHLVDDCQLFRIVLDAAGTPIEVSAGVRTVPVGLWRALLVRDGGCVWPGCDAPASWCDVAHGNRSHARHRPRSPACPTRRQAGGASGPSRGRLRPWAVRGDPRSTEPLFSDAPGDRPPHGPTEGPVRLQARPRR